VHPSRIRPQSWFVLAAAGACFASSLASQTAPVAASIVSPIAIVPVAGVQLTGAMDVGEGKAVIAVNGSVTAGDHAATITLPHRGNLKLCPTTRVNLTTDSSSNPSTGETPGLMMALGRGALEASFATGKNSDVILTPDFRILISGPGTAAVRVRLGEKGDTCVDNHGATAPYVTVNSIFDGGVYRVQPDQRVMFQHGSLHEVVDNEKESCGCPPEPSSLTAGNTSANEFPVAQSAGLEPLPKPAPNVGPPGTVSAQVTAQLSYDGDNPQAAKAAAQPPAPTTPSPAQVPPPTPKVEKKAGFFGRVGHFFRKIFGG
jgi:hypothetical protein